MSVSIKRRELLAGAPALALAVGVGSCGGDDDDEGAAFVARVRALLERWFGRGGLEFMAELGHSWEGPTELSTSSNVFEKSDDEIIEYWQGLLAENFAADDVVAVRGYCLGRTEAELCWLAALVS